MRQQIRKFGIAQTAKVAGVLYGLMGLVFLPFLLVISALSPKDADFGMGFALAMPILYGALGFIFTAIACALYNFVAKLVGGIEVETDSGGTGA